MPENKIPFDAKQFRAQFQAIDDKTIYLDSASTALKPNEMVAATIGYYSKETATSLRSKHSFALTTSDKIEQARQETAQLINARLPSEVIWTRGATEAINIVAQSYARLLLQPDDEIIISEFEHHSNLIPWLQVAKQTGAKIIKWPLAADNTLSLSTLQSLMTRNTKIVTVTQMSNVTGYQPDLQAISEITHQHHAILVVDGAQGIVHHPIDVQKLNIDFYVFSAHKLYGPTGIGVLYGKQEWLKIMDIWHGGGKMLTDTNFEHFEIASLPYKFEAGTPNIAGIIGFYAVLNWLKAINLQQAESYTHQLVDYAKLQLNSIPNIKIYNVEHSAILTFAISDIHHDDIAILLAEQNIAIRAGELCVKPLMTALGCKGVIRASLMPYNNKNDVDRLIEALQNSLQLLS